MDIKYFILSINEAKVAKYESNATLLKSNN